MNPIADFATHAAAQTRAERCEKHGPFEARRIVGSIWSRCPACGEEAEAREKAEREARAREDRRLVWLNRIGQAGIPERFQSRSLQSFVAESEAQARALDFATAYADGFDEALATGRSALFIGKPGTGKTHLAVGIGLRIMHRDRRTVLFTTVMRAIRRVKDTWGRDSRESESQAIAALAFPDLLILDEVGVQFGSDTERLILFDVLNERYERRRPTLLLSNLALNDSEEGGRVVPGIKSYLGERVFDRLREDGGEAIVFDWDSWRGRLAA